MKKIAVLLMLAGVIAGFYFSLYPLYLHAQSHTLMNVSESKYLILGFGLMSLGIGLGSVLYRTEPYYQRVKDVLGTILIICGVRLLYFFIFHG